MATNAPSFFAPATIARAYGRVSLKVARGERSADTLPPAPLGPRRILVVDDDLELAASVIRALRGDGMEVTFSTMADDVLACATRKRPDLILVHTRRGDPRALAACRRLQELDETHPPAVIAYGAGDDHEDAVVHALESGADDYIADVRRERELLARASAQLKHLRDREVMHWARAQRSSLRELANTDPLTGLANRRVVTQALDRASGQGEAVTLVLVDLDHFKRINDTFGHPAGDQVLRRVARALDGVSPPGGVTARWGGEEFAIVLSGATDGPAAEIGDRFRRAVGTIVLFEIDGMPKITASVGVAVWSGTGARPSSSQLVAAADTALYQSKRQGRDRVSTSHALAG